MIIEVFYLTHSPQAVAVFSRCIDAYNQWVLQTMEVCTRLGFESFSGPDFCVPEFFLRSRYEHIQKVTGFKLTGDDSLLAEPDHIPYSLRLDHPAGDVVFRELTRLAEDALSGLGIDRGLYGKPGAVGYQRAICMMLNIDRQVARNAFFAFSQVWAVKNENGIISLICSIPVNANHDARHGGLIYEMPVLPEGWEDISAQQVIHIFNYHNSIVKKG